MKLFLKIIRIFTLYVLLPIFLEVIGGICYSYFLHPENNFFKLISNNKTVFEIIGISIVYLILSVLIIFLFKFLRKKYLDTKRYIYKLGCLFTLISYLYILFLCLDIFIDISKWFYIHIALFCLSALGFIEIIQILIIEIYNKISLVFFIKKILRTGQFKYSLPILIANKFYMKNDFICKLYTFFNEPVNFYFKKMKEKNLSLLKNNFNQSEIDLLNKQELHQELKTVKHEGLPDMYEKSARLAEEISKGGGILWFTNMKTPVHYVKTHSAVRHYQNIQNIMLNNENIDARRIHLFCYNFLDSLNKEEDIKNINLLLNYLIVELLYGINNRVLLIGKTIHNFYSDFRNGKNNKRFIAGVFLLDYAVYMSDTTNIAIKDILFSDYCIEKPIMEQDPDSELREKVRRLSNKSSFEFFKKNYEYIWNLNKTTDENINIFNLEEKIKREIDYVKNKNVLRILDFFELCKIAKDAYKFKFDIDTPVMNTAIEQISKLKGTSIENIKKIINEAYEKTNSKEDFFQILTPIIQRKIFILT